MHCATEMEAVQGLYVESIKKYNSFKIALYHPTQHISHIPLSTACTKAG